MKRHQRIPEDDLEEVLGAILLQERLVRFASELRGEDRVIMDRRLLSSRPASIRSLSEELGLPYGRTRERVRSLEERLRHAVRDPARGRHRRAA